MIRDITIGQYYSGNSVIHRMDPRTKLAITFLYAISLFLCKDWIMILAATAFLCIYVAVSRVPITYICRGTEGHMDVYSVYSNIQRVQRGRTGTLELAQTSHNR